MNPLEILQVTLDTLLYPDGVHAYWQRKAKTGDPDEYIVYTLDGDPAEFWADDETTIRTANIALRYYYRDTLLGTSAGRKKIRDRAAAIVAALEAAEFDVPNGAFDAGDIDDIGFGTTIIECFYGRAV